MLFSSSLILLVLSCLLAGELGPQFLSWSSLSSSSTTGRHFGAMAAASQGGDSYRDDQEMTEEQAEKIRILTEMIRSRTSLECRTAIEAAMSDGSEIPERCKEEVTEIYSQLVKEDGEDYSNLGADDGEYESPQGGDNNGNRRSREQRGDTQSNNKGSIPLPSKQWVSAQMAIIVFIVSTISVIAFICYKNRALIFAPPAERPKEKKDKDKQKRR